jgi:hypothetical protein
MRTTKTCPSMMKKHNPPKVLAKETMNPRILKGEGEGNNDQEQDLSQRDRFLTKDRGTKRDERGNMGRRAYWEKEYPDCAGDGNQSYSGRRV